MDKSVNFDNWFNVKDDEVWGVSDELPTQKNWQKSMDKNHTRRKRRRRIFNLKNYLISFRVSSL